MAALHRSCTSKTCLSSGTFWHTHSLDGVMSRETSCLTTLPLSASRSRSCCAARYEDAERPPTSQAIERNGVAPPVARRFALVVDHSQFGCLNSPNALPLIIG